MGLRTRKEPENGVKMAGCSDMASGITVKMEIILEENPYEDNGTFKTGKHCPGRESVR